MLATYRAVLKGDRLEWTEITPDLPDHEGVPVYVILLDAPAGEQVQRGQRMASILAELAAAGGVSSISDPVAWQREIRKDRPLPGRDVS